MVEAGDNVGPFVARLRDERGGTGGDAALKNTSAVPQNSRSLSFSSLLRTLQLMSTGRSAQLGEEGEVRHYARSNQLLRSSVATRLPSVRAKPVIGGRSLSLPVFLSVTSPLLSP